MIPKENEDTIPVHTLSDSHINVLNALESASGNSDAGNNTAVLLHYYIIHLRFCLLS